MNKRNKIITVIVEGGIIQEIMKIPAGITIKVVDYAEGEGDDRTQMVKLGNDEPEPAYVSYWRKA